MKNGNSSNLISNKKGNAIADSIFILLVLIPFAIIIVLSYQTFTDLNDDIQASDDLHNLSKNVSGDLHNRFPAVFDGIFIFIVGLLWVLVIAASFRIDAHPLFFILTVLLLVVVMFASSLLTNVYVDFSEDAEMQVFAEEFPMTNFVLQNMLKTVLVMGFSIVIVLFAKNKFIGV